MEPANHNVQNSLLESQGKLDAASAAAREYANSPSVAASNSADEAKRILDSGVAEGHNDVEQYKGTLNNAVNTAVARGVELKDASAKVVSDNIDKVKSTETFQNASTTAQPYVDQAGGILSQASATAAQTTSSVANAASVVAHKVVEAGQAGAAILKDAASSIQSQGIAASSRDLARSVGDKTAPVANNVYASASGAVAAAVSGATAVTHAIVDPVVDAAVNLTGHITGSAATDASAPEGTVPKMSKADQKVVVQPIIESKTLVIEE